jgi:hypothetical protein
MACQTERATNYINFAKKKSRRWPDAVLTVKMALFKPRAGAIVARRSCHADPLGYNRLVRQIVVREAVVTLATAA